MWEQYKRTFWGMQIFICSVTVAIFIWAHLVLLSAIFFLTMQLGALLGAVWAARLKNKLERAAASGPRVMLRGS
jgi:uncharacterized protein involved in cysteine biosynthesis